VPFLLPCIMDSSIEISVYWSGCLYKADLTSPIDISIPIRDPRKGEGPAAWYVGRPRFEAVEAEGFIGSVAKGGAVNFTNVIFNPHGHGTHTECLGHITKEAESVNEVELPLIIPCLVHSIHPEVINGDSVITVDSLPGGKETNAKLPLAMVIRTLPNKASKKGKDWSNSNPTYLDSEFTTKLVERGVEHLLVDLPSVDKEVDGGALLSHRAFFRVPDAPRANATITEFVYTPSGVQDGLYALNLQLAPFDLDASPSRPVIYPLSAI
jgi:kynurenine formamidase